MWADRPSIDLEVQMSSQTRSTEIPLASASGYLMIGVAILLLLAGVAALVQVPLLGPRALLLAVPLILASLFVASGMYMLQPNESAVMLLFGAYKGTDRSEGLCWANPFYKKRKLSLRAHNLNSDKLKVNDLRGNPIEIAAAIVWRVRDTAQAIFDVEDYDTYVRVQAEAAIRHLASSYAYDEGEAEAHTQITLRSGQDEVAAALKRLIRSASGFKSSIRRGSSPGSRRRRALRRHRVEKREAGSSVAESPTRLPPAAPVADGVARQCARHRLLPPPDPPPLPRYRVRDRPAGRAAAGRHRLCLCRR